ncbi:hypothetical protein JKP88DRAFT_234129 [Tribonema minus]|uniref:Ubiquilin n=1 Tax=Tribonema minus TaxID=303371 RepID=A0A835Z7M7_9STRA|nr:hypothetical protein JKP88DRAFT_234129 [Tribonema minus]
MSSVVHIRCSNAQKFTVPLDTSVTVGAFKATIAEQAQVPAESQRLIYKGRVLKDDQTLASYDVQPDTTIHLVRGARPAGEAAAAAPTAAAAPAGMPAAAAAAPAAPPAFGGAPAGGSAADMLGMMQGMMGGGADISRMQQQLLSNPEMMANIMNSPMMQGLLNDPETLRSMVTGNPQMRQVLEANPQLAHVFNDPAVIRQSLEMMRNPAAMREAMRSQDRAMSNLETHPEGFNALRRMYTEMQEPMMEAMSNPEQQQQQSGSGGGGAGAAAGTAMPNPWAAPGAAPQAAGAAGAGAAGANPWSSLMGGAGGPPPAGMAPPGMAQDPAAVLNMMQNPMAQDMIRQMTSNPAVVEQMLNMNPQLRAMVDAQPGMRQQLPQLLSGMSDPANLQAMIQMQQSMAQLQRAGIMPPIPGMPPMPGAPAAATPGAPPAAAGGLDFSALLAGHGVGMPPGSGAAVPPAWLAAAQPPPPPANPAEAYAAQLAQLRAMGFSDDAASLRALVDARGNVNAAVERLIGGM